MSCACSCSLQWCSLCVFPPVPFLHSALVRLGSSLLQDLSKRLGDILSSLFIQLRDSQASSQLRG